MLMCLSLSSSKRDVYEEDFEKPFLQMSREFYKVRMIILTEWINELMIGGESKVVS